MVSSFFPGLLVSAMSWIFLAHRIESARVQRMAAQ